MTIEALESLIAQKVRAAAKELMQQACRVMDEELVSKGSVLVDRRRPRDILTGFGWLRLSRWYVRDQGTRAYKYPLDEVLGLAPRVHVTPAVLELAVALAVRLPYRQANYLLKQVIHADLDYRTLHAWVQVAGKKMVEVEDEEQVAVFEDGEIAPTDPRDREIVVAEVDGTFVKAQRENGADFEVRIGVLASGKSLESKTAKHKRYRLLERVRYGGVDNAADFGERLFLAGEKTLGLSHARHLLLIGDGADWIEDLAGHERWKAVYQLDWWHLIHAFHRTFPEYPEIIAQLKSALYEGEDEQLVRLVKFASIEGYGDPEKVAALESYVIANQDGLYGARRLRRQLSDEAKLVAVEGSGAVEKQMDIVVGRRFKRQGMRWTRKGVNRLLKLRLRELDRAA
ncbi:MAG: UPF0236 family protein [bacterium]|nr:UPF0236 family protein [bacterium]